jgi:hypothetical protein
VYHLGTDLIQFPHRKTLVAAQSYGPKPILADFIIALNAHVFRLVAVEAPPREDLILFQIKNI